MIPNVLFQKERDAAGENISQKFLEFLDTYFKI